MDFFVVVAVVRRFEQSTKQQPFSVQCFCGKILKKGPHFMCALYCAREREREKDNAMAEYSILFTFSYAAVCTLSLILLLLLILVFSKRFG